MKIKLTILFFSFSLAASLYAQQTPKDTLYFCKTYINGAEIGLANSFVMNPNGDEITVMARTYAPINELSITIRVERILPDSTALVSNTKYDVQPEWDYIFFSGVKFSSAGRYHVSLVKNDGTVVAGNNVKMIIRKKKY